MSNCLHCRPAARVKVLLAVEVEVPDPTNEHGELPYAYKHWDTSAPEVREFEIALSEAARRAIETEPAVLEVEGFELLPPTAPS